MSEIQAAIATFKVHFQGRHGEDFLMRAEVLVWRLLLRPARVGNLQPWKPRELVDAYGKVFLQLLAGSGEIVCSSMIPTSNYFPISVGNSAELVSDFEPINMANGGLRAFAAGARGSDRGTESGHANILLCGIVNLIETAQK